MKPLYVAATGQHVGKTTSTLGLVTNIVEHGYNVGYCKPVGQQHLYVEGQMIDKDVTLFSQILKFKIDGSLHSPVVMARGVTKKYIDDPSQFRFRENIIHASQQLKKQHDMVVYEGQGVIVRCHSGKTIWQATITLPNIGKVVFSFDVVY